MLIVGGFGIAVGVEGVVIPGGIVEHHVLEELRAKSVHEAALGRRTGDPDGPTAEFALAPRSVAGKYPAVGIVASGVKLLQRGHLRRGQTGVRFGRLACQHRGIEMAARRVFDDAVFHPVQLVAGGQRGGLNGGQFLRRNVAVFLAGQRQVSHAALASR